MTKSKGFICLSEGYRKFSLGVLQGLRDHDFGSRDSTNIIWMRLIGSLSLSIHILSANFDLLMIGEKSCKGPSQIRHPPDRYLSSILFMTVLLRGMPLA